MFIKDLNLYINEKNIVTIKPFLKLLGGTYGLTINGVDYVFGELYRVDEDINKAILGKMKALQTQIIKKIEGK